MLELTTVVLIALVVDLLFIACQWITRFWTSICSHVISALLGSYLFPLLPSFSSANGIERERHTIYTPVHFYTLFVSMELHETLPFLTYRNCYNNNINTLSRNHDVSNANSKSSHIYFFPITVCPSVRPSVRPSVCLSVCLSVCRKKR